MRYFPDARSHWWTAIPALLLPIACGVVLLGQHTPPTMRSLALATRPVAMVLDAHRERAFVLGADASVWLVDLAHARVVRTLAGDAAPTGALPSLALAARSQHLFVVDPRDGLGPSLVRVLDSRSGALRATVRVGPGADALAVDDRRSHVFVATAGDGRVRVLDSRTARLLHTVRVGAAPVALAVDARTARAFVLGYPIVHGWDSTNPFRVPNQLSVLDTTSGTLQRTVTVGAGPGTLALDARGGRVFVTNGSAGTLSVLDAHDGTLLHTVTVGGEPSAVAVDERRGRIYVADAGAGTLSLLDAARGMLLATAQVDPTASPADPLPAALAVDTARDRVYLSTWGPLAQGQGLTLRGTGTLYVLDARTLALRRTLEVGVAPQAVAVEAGSERVVVLNGGGTVLHQPNGWAELWLQGRRTWLPWLGRIGPRPSEAPCVPGSVSVLAAGA